ncbi:hypothetical protein HYH02_012636 [Chlamydomonas schloesseri]|uniref:Uncharacterized protein n=1 Tax=Chlamydomonas schloesseri TaxID=2026947 RepID=A0A835T0G6_9CHLO|nr:hypothetical protein HYH02_012636 [Chlamydomonas schloesseri]|eukprot:KAG2433518.1 hypothetical protein HYH02_012636 [Chlamydomonas schloesseri]
MAVEVHGVSQLVSELASEYDRSRAFLSALEQSLQESRANEDGPEANADGSLAPETDAQAPEAICDAQQGAAPPKKSGSLKGKLARFFSRRESKSSSSSKVVVVDPTAENNTNVSSVQGLRRASVVALGDHIEDSCVVSSGHSQLAKRSQSFMTRSGNSLAAMPAPHMSSAAVLRATTSFRATPTTSASQIHADGLVPPYPAAPTVAASASQLSLPAVDLRHSSFSLARGSGGTAGGGGLPSLGHASSMRRRSVEELLGQAPSASGVSFSGGGSARRASIEMPYGAAGTAALLPTTSGHGAAAGCGAVKSTGTSCGATSGTSLFKKLQQLHVPMSECGLPELPQCSPHATLAGSTMFGPPCGTGGPPCGPGGPGSPAAATVAGSPAAAAAAAGASVSTAASAAASQHRALSMSMSMQHSPSSQRRSVTSAQHTFIDAASTLHSVPSMDGGAGGAGGGNALLGSASPSGASARRSSLHMPPSASLSLSALRSQSFRHGGGSRGSTGTGCGACAATAAAAIINEHADLAPEGNDDDHDDQGDGEETTAGGIEAAMPARRTASVGPVAGGAASSLMANLLRRADVVMAAAAAAAPTIGGGGGGGSGAAFPCLASGHGMIVHVAAVDPSSDAVCASGMSEAGALLGAAGAEVTSGTTGSRQASGAALFVPGGGGGEVCASRSSRRLTTTQLAIPPLGSPVGQRPLLQAHHSSGHALSPTPPPAGPLAPQPPHGVHSAAGAGDGSHSPAPGASGGASYLSQHRRMSFRASSSSTYVHGSAAAGQSGGTIFVI